MTGGSVNLRLYRRARCDGETLERACELSGLTLGEARLTDAEDARNPPPPEAYELLDQKRGAGRDECPAPISDIKESIMATAAAATVDGEVPKHDFALAVRIYRTDIKKAASKVGEFNQELSTAYKAIKKNANIQPSAAKLAFKLDDMEESKRDDFLRSLNGLLKELNIHMPSDLVDQAEGKEREPVIPRRRPNLAAVPPVSDGEDADLADGEE